MQQTAIKLGKVGLIILAIPIVLYLMVITVSLAHATTTPNLSVCHPNNGEEGSKGGWSLIKPDQASKHIDETKYPSGEYWKHESKDGRHDVYADAQGNCPTVPEPCTYNKNIAATDPKCVSPCPEGTTLVDYEGDGFDKPFCRGTPTGCPYADQIPVDSPKCVPPVEVENTTPTPVTTEETEVFYGK